MYNVSSLLDFMLFVYNWLLNGVSSSVFGYFLYKQKYPNLHEREGEEGYPAYWKYIKI